MTAELPLDAASVTLGILAGGRGSRLGGRDKAWLQRDGVPQVVRIARRFGDGCGRVLVSANTGRERYVAAGLDVVADTVTGIGPLAGLQALAAACTTPWLLTLPVDIVDAGDGLLPALAAAGTPGAFAEDEDGLQPLVALHARDPLRVALVEAMSANAHAVQDLHARLGLHCVTFKGVRFGNLNTPADLLAAGVADD